MTIPLLHPVLAKDGVTQLTEIRVKAGTTVQVAMSECNLNTKTWGPDAREFRLERWLEPLPDSVTGASVPGIYSHLCVSLCGILSSTDEIPSKDDLHRRFKILLRHAVCRIRNE